MADEKKSDLAALIADGIVNRKQDVSIDLNGRELKFTAHEIGYLTKQSLALREARGELMLPHVLALSIVDEAGDHMTPEQAGALRKDVADKLMDAVRDVNKPDDAGKK